MYTDKLCRSKIVVRLAVCEATPANSRTDRGFAAQLLTGSCAFQDEVYVSQQRGATLGAQHSEGLFFDKSVCVKISRNKTVTKEIASVRALIFDDLLRSLIEHGFPRIDPFGPVSYLGSSTDNSRQHATAHYGALRRTTARSAR